MANNKVLKRRVVVTGLGAITPIGNSVAEFWDGIRKGKVGIGEITKFDTTDYKVKLAAEVKDFVPGDHMDKKAARRMEAFSQYAVAAAREAYEDSGLEIEKEDPFRAGVMIGSGIGSLQVAEQSYEKILTEGTGKSESAYGAFDDFQYGGGKCVNSVRIPWKMQQCRNCLRHRNELYW